MKPELIPVVDENDKVLYYKERKLLKHPDEIYRVSSLWLTNSKGEVLIAQRGPYESNPGQWGPAVAGTIDKGESYLQNIVKETKEEIGLQGIEFTIGPKLFVDHERRYFAQWFYGASNKDSSEFELEVDNVNAVEWVNQDTLLKEAKKNPQKYVTDFYNKAKTLIVNQPDF